MPVLIEPLATPYLERVEMTAICMDDKRASVWLELTNYQHVLGHASAKAGAIGRAYVGAVQAGNDWTLIAKAPKAKERHLIEPTMPHDDVHEFHKAILAEWNKFTPATAKEYAKGTTLGKSFTPASFVAKALKTGYEALKIKRDAYSGVKLGEWKPDDLLKYAERMKTAPPAPPKPGEPRVDNLGFAELVPDPMWGGAKEATYAGEIDKKFQPILSSRPHSGKFAYEDLFTQNPELKGYQGVKRIVAYGFRADNRPPEEIKKAGGMWPSYTRPDKQADAAAEADPAKRAKWESDILNLREHVSDEFLKGFVSTSKSVGAAKFFVQEDGYIYAVLAEGAFEVPPGSLHENEQELAMPGGLDWDDIVGFRRAGKGFAKKLKGLLYLKPAALQGEKPVVATAVVAALSGMSLASG
jgi:hypothetical protein